MGSAGAIRRSERYISKGWPIIAPTEFPIHFHYPLNARERQQARLKGSTRTYGTCLMIPGRRYVLMPHGRMRRLYAGPMHD